MAKREDEMTDRRTIPGFPDYAIDRDGVVWRVTPTIRQVEVRRGPTPRKLAVTWCGNGRSPKRYACVGLVPPGQVNSRKRSVAELMRVVWPEVAL